MKNEQIIFNESMRLMNEGILKGTGRKFLVELEDGTKQEVEEPEPIHTFAAWKSIGRQVKKGQHAKAQIYIWKQGKPYTVKAKNQDGEEVEKEVQGKMFMKLAFFFTLDQTEPIKAEKKAAPELETVNSFVIDANYIDSLLEA